MESVFTAINILAILVGAAAFVLAYALLVPKRSSKFAPSNQLEREGNQGVRILTALGSEIYSVLPEVSKETRYDDSILKNLIQRAGNPWGLTPREFRFIRFITMLIGGLVGVAIWFITALLGYSFPWYVVMAIAAIIGFFIPDITHREKATERDIEFKRDLPEALDLITITVASGKTFEQSLRETIPHIRDSSLKTELASVVQAIDSGKTLRSALDDLAERMPSSGIVTFIRSVQESAELNVSLEETLESRSAESREELFALIREKTAALPTKMAGVLAPTLAFALMIILLAPFITSLMEVLTS